MSIVQTEDVLREIRSGELDTVTSIIDERGLYYAKEWSGGYIFLQEAIKSEKWKIAKMLLSRGAEINPTINGLGYTPLHCAIENNNTEMVDMLLEKQANPNIKGDSGTTLLHSAVFVGNVKIVKSLLNVNVDVNGKDRSGVSVIESAINQDKAKIVKILLAKKALIDPKSSHGINALHLAIKSGERSIVIYLLNRGADVNSIIPSSSRPNYTPLHHATLMGNEEIVKLLLSRGANIDAITGENETALSIAEKYKHDEIVKLLSEHQTPEVEAKTDIEEYQKCIRDAVCMHWPDDEKCRKFIATISKHDCTVSPKDAEDSEFFHVIVEKGCVKILQDLLKYRVDVNSVSLDQRGYTLLYSAIANKHLEVAKLLIENNANVNVTVQANYCNELPISLAIEKVDVDMVKLLLDNGTDLRGRHDVLHHALKKESKEIVEMILNNNPNIGINSRDLSGRTALYYAIHDNYHFIRRNGNKNDIRFNLVKLLLSRGAKVNVHDNTGASPLHIAVLSEQIKVIEILLEHNENMNCMIDDAKKTQLKYWMEHGDEKIRKLLLENGTNIDAAIKDGKIKLYVASQRYGTIEGKKCMFPMLIKSGPSIDCRDKRGRTALHVACERGAKMEGEKCIVSMLIKSGADIDSRDNSHETPLHIAVANDSLEIVQILLNHFANVETQNVAGMTPLHVAAKLKFPKIVQELLIYGSNVNVKCRERRTPLYYGLYYSDYEDNPYKNEEAYDECDCFQCPHDLVENHYCDDYSNCTFKRPARFNEVGEILAQHIMRIRALNMNVFKWNCRMVERVAENKIFYEKCKNEIQPLKNTQITDTNVSYYDLLTKGINQLTMYARNEKIVQTVESNDYDEMFPNYCDMIRNNLKRGQRRENLLNLGQNSLDVLLRSSLPVTFSLLSNLSNKDLRSLPVTCSLKLLSYLSHKDLRSLTKACRIDNGNETIG